jgi:peroxiredoxin
MKPARMNLLLYFVVFALAAEVVFLVVQNRRLQAQIIASRTQLPPVMIKKGEQVEPVDILSFSGAKEKLSFGASKPNRLIYVFNTRCPVCQFTQPKWKQLYEETSALISVMAVSSSDSLTAMAKYQQSNEIDFPMFVAADSLFRSTFKITFVPQTILLDSSGVVLGQWAGALQDSHMKEIREIIASL